MRKHLLLCGLLLLAAAATASHAATITILNGDDPFEGFNDATPVAPVGGNPGTTRGAQRLNAFQHAADIWGSLLPSNVEILVQATFDPLACSASSGVLGAAAAVGVDADFPGAPFAGTWYHIALANKLTGADLSPLEADIETYFNSSIDDDPNCLSGRDWYYGYDGNEGTNVDLLPVVLHELAHGLGFSTFTTLSTGAFLGGLPDVYSRFILDKTVNKHWHEMTNGERQASAVNTSKVHWDGAAVRGAAGLLLGPRPVMDVNSPSGIAGQYAIGTAAFGPSLRYINGDLALVDDGAAPTTDACTPIVNVAEVQGKIAVIDRGTCTFVSKTLAAQAAGARAVIIVNNVAGITPPGLGGSDPSVHIVAVSVTQADGNLLKAALASGPVNVTLRTDPTQIAGADSTGRVLLYAPNPVQQGSSISHFDVSCTPNILMEPSLSGDLDAGDVDLTRFHFQDIGWFTGATDAAAERAPVATRFRGNVPNPFNPATAIHFDLAADGEARLDVYDLAGRLVKRLARGAMTAGPHVLRWDGTDERGRPVAAGVYVARLEAGGWVDARRMVCVK